MKVIILENNIDTRELLIAAINEPCIPIEEDFKVNKLKNARISHEGIYINKDEELKNVKQNGWYRKFEKRKR